MSAILTASWVNCHWMIDQFPLFDLLFELLDLFPVIYAHIKRFNLIKKLFGGHAAHFTASLLIVSIVLPLRLGSEWKLCDMQRVGSMALGHGSPLAFDHVMDDLKRLVKHSFLGGLVVYLTTGSTALSGLIQIGTRRASVISSTVTQLFFPCSSPEEVC